MASVSRAVKRIIDARPMLHDALSHGIVSFANLAEHIKALAEQELGEKVSEAALVMALRRHAEKLKPIYGKKLPSKAHSELIMKTGLCDVTIVKTPKLLSELSQIYKLIDMDRGETLNIIQGNYEVTIVISEKYRARLLKVLSNEKVKNTEKDLVSLTMSFPKEFLYTPGVIARVVRKLAWENINIYEVISTMTELIFIVDKKSSIRAHSALQQLIDEERSI